MHIYHSGSMGCSIVRKWKKRVPTNRTFMEIFIFIPVRIVCMASVKDMAIDVLRELKLFLSFTPNRVWVVIVGLFLIGYRSMKFFL